MAGAMTGRVAVVTGAASGIGKAIAIAFAKEGASVAVADVDENGGKKTVAEIGNVGAKGMFIKCDVSKKAEVQAMVEATIKKFSRLDFACNNAGVHYTLPGSFTETDEEVWDETIAVNLKGVFLCMKCEIPQMLKQGSGVIVNTASVAGLVGEPFGYSYTASKHGVVGLTKAVAFEYAKKGIRVNAVCPGGVVTPMTDRMPDEVRQMIVNWTPVGRLAAPEEIASAVMWLCSDLAAFVTGAAVVLDGGLSTV